MAETSKVIAKKRDRAGKGGARSSRRDGLIPAVIYGDKQPPLMIAVEPKSVERELHKEGFFNHQLKIDVDGTGYDVLPRDVQVDPVTDKPLHLDFLRIGPELDHHRAGAGPLQERSGVARHQARRRAEHRAARDHRAHQARHHPRVLRGRPDRPRDRPLGPSVGAGDPRGRARGEPRQERHRGLDRRTDRGARGGGPGGGGCSGSGVGSGGSRGCGSGGRCGSGGGCSTRSGCGSGGGRRLRQPAARPRLRPRSKRRASSPYVRCFCWSGSAIPGRAMRGTGTTLDSWRRTRSSAAVSSRRGVRVSTARWPKAISAASAR